jgi:hypothetical protein
VPGAGKELLAMMAIDGVTRGARDLAQGIRVRGA